MNKRDDIKNLREFFREVTHLTIDSHFDNRDYDKMIRSFRTGDCLIIKMRIDAVPNDIIWANKLDGHPLTPELYRKILDLNRKALSR